MNSLIGYRIRPGKSSPKPVDHMIKKATCRADSRTLVKELYLGRGRLIYIMTEKKKRGGEVPEPFRSHTGVNLRCLYSLIKDKSDIK